MNHNKSFVLMAVLSAFLFTSESAFAEILITVTPSVSPNIISNLDPNSPNPSLTTWQTNAVLALEGGLLSNGTVGTPGFYAAQNTINGMQSVADSGIPSVSSFPSWLGQVDPGSNYINETGNAVRYGVVIHDTTGTFTLAQLGFEYTDQYANTPGGAFLSGTIPAGSYTDLTGFAAFDNGVQVFDPNAAITDLYGSGSGFSTNSAVCIVGDPTYDCTPAGEQAALNATNSVVGVDGDMVTGTYFLVDPVTGTNVIATGDSTFTITPEPSTWFLMISAVPVIGAIRRRRQSHG